MRRHAVKSTAQFDGKPEFASSGIATNRHQEPCARSVHQQIGGALRIQIPKIQIPNARMAASYRAVPPSPSPLLEYRLLRLLRGRPRRPRPHTVNVNLGCISKNADETIR